MHFRGRIVTLDNGPGPVVPDGTYLRWKSLSADVFDIAVGVRLDAPGLASI